MASDLVVRPVTTRRQRQQFLKLAWQLHAEDPNWMPPLRSNQAELVGYPTSWFGQAKAHPFYRTADVQTFLAFRGDRPCGRIVAIVNEAYNQSNDQPRGFFGFFESIDDQQVANGLLDAAYQWVRQRGLDVMRGPFNPSMNYECGLLIEGFDTPPFFMMTYNPPYYGRLLEEYGLQKSQDMFAFWGHVDMLASLDQKLAFISNAARERFHIDVRPLDKKRFRADVNAFIDIYNQSNIGSWGFVPISPDESQVVAASLRRLIVPELTTFAEVDGKPVGAVFGLLDYNPRVKAIDGRLFPLGFVKLLGNRREIKRIRILSTNVLPAYQRWGVALVMLAALVPKAIAWGIEEAEFSWVLESNSLSRGSLERGGAKRTKTYRIYDYSAASDPASTAS
jgi:GNAT superfamily N-acetyltransferase